MNITTKFNIDDRVWLIKDNKIIQVTISAIEVFYVATNMDRVTYNAKNITNSVSWLDHQKLQESLLFKSKKDLLLSLDPEATSCAGINCEAVNGYGHSKECELEHEGNYKGVTV